jgi:hypothetical protein
MAKKRNIMDVQPAKLRHQSVHGRKKTSFTPASQAMATAAKAAIALRTHAIHVNENSSPSDSVNKLIAAKKSEPRSIQKYGAEFANG